MTKAFAAVLLAGIAVAAEKSEPAMEVGDGFQVQLLLKEPQIRQPLSITFDERGRMWVIQYLQYPTPTGLVPVKVDGWLRTKYDRRPEPPPRGPVGADRITICETTSDGTWKTRDFLTGLNLCTGLALGHGGAFVLQAPYLLFYADRNHDDVPDSDPEVLLTGFGLEDAHALANSLTWGPDGWLYGAQGSTVTANVRGLEFQQGIWRYHPITKTFELFVEGGGNTWGLDFDGNGEVLAGTNFDEKMLHHVQGAYYVKNFGKHGELHNPHTYGYFGHVPYSGYRGGHISIGGIVYHGGAFPVNFEGAYIFGNTLDHAVYWASLQRKGSSFTAKFEGTLMKIAGELFRPVDCELGPDGAVYVADWCDKRASHVDPLDTWDRSDGRIYRISPRKPASEVKTGSFDLGKLSSKQLMNLLSSTNAWFARKARLLLAEKKDATVVPALRQQVLSATDSHLALQSLWALYVSGGFDDALAEQLLTNRHEHVRAWTVRLLGDSFKVSRPIQAALIARARADSSAAVRSQLACTAKRLPGVDALPILEQLWMHTNDADDPHIPLLTWWALEDKAVADRQQVLKLFSKRQTWDSVLVQKHIAGRLARRYANAGTDGLVACAELLESAPDESSKKQLMKGIDEALAGSALKNPPARLTQWFDQAWPARKADMDYVRFGVRLRMAEPMALAKQRVQNGNEAQNIREQLIELLSEAAEPGSEAILVGALQASKSSKLQLAALRGLQRFESAQVAEEILALHSSLDKELQKSALDVLCRRAAWGRLLVAAVAAGKLDAGQIRLEQLRQMVALGDPELSQQIEKRWGRLQATSPQEKQSTINRLKLVLKPSGVVGRVPKSDLAAGHQLFQTACGTCHKLFDEGNSIGPDLTGADRKNVDSLLEHIVNPSGYIRPEYANFEAELKDGRVITGLIVESSGSTVTIVDRNNERYTLPREQVALLKESAVSLMPEGLLEALPPQSVIDLMGYLQQDGPPQLQSSRSNTSR